MNMNGIDPRRGNRIRQVKMGKCASIIKRYQNQMRAKTIRASSIIRASWSCKDLL